MPSPPSPRHPTYFAQSLHARAAAAIAWIGARSEREIVVVSHASFLKHLFGFGHAGEKKDLTAMPKCFEYDSDVTMSADKGPFAMWMRGYFDNCEMKSVVCTWP